MQKLQLQRESLLRHKSEREEKFSLLENNSKTHIDALAAKAEEVAQLTTQLSDATLELQVL